SSRQAQAKDPVKTDQQRILGTWRVTGGQINGQELPAEYKAFVRMTFAKDGKMAMKILEEGKEGTYKIPAAGSIDLLVQDQQPGPGIYKFEGDDRFTLCIRENGGNRPTEFSGAQGTGQILLVLERAKPGDEKLSPEEAAKYKEAIEKV